MIRVHPEVAQPGQQVHVSGVLPSEWLVQGEAVLQLLDGAGEVMGQSRLVVEKNRIESALRVPPTAEEGPYELVILSQGRSSLLASLTVLSGLSLKRLRGAFKAEGQRNKAYDLIAGDELEPAAELLSSAEAFYRKNGWEHLEAETMLERAHVLERAGRQVEQKNLLEAALTKFHLAGVKSKQSSAYGKAWLYFERAIDLATRLNREKDLIINSNNLGEILLRLELLHEAKEHLLRALGGALKVRDRRIEATVRTNLGSTHVRERHYREALAQWNRAIELFNEVREHENAKRLMVGCRNLREMLARDHEGRFRMTDDLLETPED